MNEQVITIEPEGERQPKQARRSRAGQWILIYAAVLVAVFLAGFGPMWFKARGVSRQLAATEQKARVDRMQILLANAAIDSRRGEYERARKAASEFFTRLATLSGTNNDKLLSQRDELITLLARSDPASAERLTQLYIAFRGGAETAPGSTNQLAHNAK